MQAVLHIFPEWWPLLTTLPVIGVPIKSSNSIDGWDSILSILQMPNGVPVATVALNAAKNAGIIAAQIIGISDGIVNKKLEVYKKQLSDEVQSKANKIKEGGWLTILINKNGK